MLTLPPWLTHIEDSRLLNWALHGLQALLVVALTLLALRLVRMGLARLGLGLQAMASTRGEHKRVETLMRVARYVANLVLGVLGLLAVLHTLGVSIAPMLAAAGVVGIAVGFGAQSLVKDYFTGVVLLLENQIRIGDIVTLDNRTGTVETITLRYVRLRDGEGHVHFVPNGVITAVTNLSMGFSYAVVDIGVGHQANLNQVETLMQDAATQLQTDPHWQQKFKEGGQFSLLGVQALAESTVVLRCRFKTVGGEQWAVRREYNRRIKAAFDQAGVELAFPAKTTPQNANTKNLI